MSSAKNQPNVMGIHQVILMNLTCSLNAMSSITDDFILHVSQLGRKCGWRWSWHDCMRGWVGTCRATHKHFFGECVSAISIPCNSGLGFNALSINDMLSCLQARSSAHTHTHTPKQISKLPSGFHLANGSLHAGLSVNRYLLLYLLSAAKLANLI